MNKNKEIQARRIRRRYHVRSKVRGDADHPRMSIHRSLKHFGCQLVDDLTGRTLASASTRDKALQNELAGGGGNCDAAAKVGAAIAEKAKAAGVSVVKLDRGHSKYHGRVKAFADAAREGGLQF